MANSHGASSIRYSQVSGKQLFLPPKNPLSMASSFFTDYNSIHHPGPIQREGFRPHQRTNSESYLLEEQPSWLDDLLNDPETPAKKGVHRRSSSDSFAYLDTSSIFQNIDNLAQEGCKHQSITSLPSWGSEEFGYLNDMQHSSSSMEANSFGGPQGTRREAMNRVAAASGIVPLGKNKNVRASSSSAAMGPDATEKKFQDESAPDKEVPSERREGLQAKNTNSDMDKRAKQQFAQRSRVRKLQYIAELERNVQALQAEGLEFAAQLEFLDQQNIILDMENKALKQRLDSLAQEHLVKCLQQEMLEREIARFRALYYHQQQQQQQQHMQQPPPMHRRNRSRDLDSQFNNLSLRQTETSSGADTARGPLHI